MTDSVDNLLKDAVRKVVLEALAEATQANTSAAATAVNLKKRNDAIVNEKFRFAYRSIMGAVAAVAICGVAYGVIFAPELASAAMGDYHEIPYAPAYHQSTYISAAAADNNDSCPREGRRDISYKE